MKNQMVAFESPTPRPKSSREAYWVGEMPALDFLFIRQSAVSLSFRFVFVYVFDRVLN